MEQYVITDVFSYAPRNLLSIEDIGDIFKKHFSGNDDKYPEYSMADYYKGMAVTGEPLGAINELRDSGLNVAVIRKDLEIIAIVGYTIKDAGEKE